MEPPIDFGIVFTKRIYLRLRLGYPALGEAPVVPAPKQSLLDTHDP
jgi:hypothetical protein